MRIPRVYLPLAFSLGADILLPEDAGHYLTRVLRMEAGRPLHVFNGEGGEYAAELIEASKKAVRIRLLTFTPDNRQSPLATHMAIGVSKGERFEWALQKAVELGVTTITPLLTERTEVRLKGDRQDKKNEHWQKILISAAEQCQRNLLPQLNPIAELADFVAAGEADIKLVLHHRTAQKLQQYAAPTSIILLIGPEGGLSEGEIAAALAAGFSPLALGPRVLRTETAPVAALSVLQFLWGDWTD